MKLLQTIVMLFGAALAGCQPQGLSSDQSPSPAAHVDRVQLFAFPTAINMGAVPGPGGISVQIFFFQLSEAPDGKVNTKTVPVSGTVDVMMFDGQMRASDMPKATPRHVWHFAPGEIGPYLSHSALGYHYAISLPWGKDEPAATMVTAIVRYSPPNEQPMYSEELPIAVGPK
jgi:hypothetical protein